LVAVSFNLQVAIGYHEVVHLRRVDHRTWDKEVGELDLEEDALIVYKIEGTIN
jgi:hypothetical protein